MAKADNFKFYSASLQKHGQSAKGLNWHSQPYQVLRFEKLCELLPDDLENYTLGDIGCGFGDLYDYLDPKPKSYTGYDMMQEMVAITQKATKQEAVLLDATITSPKTADYHVCSGALNILTKFETTLFIQNCFKASKKGFIFNCLTGNRESQLFNYLSKPFLENLAEALHVTRTEYKENYIPNDITVGFFR